MRPKQALRQLLVVAALLVLGCALGAEQREAPTSPRWTSRSIPEA